MSIEKDFEKQKIKSELLGKQADEHAKKSLIEKIKGFFGRILDKLIIDAIILEIKQVPGSKLLSLIIRILRWFTG